MAYNTNLYFIIFLPLAMVFYQLMPKRLRWVSLLISSVVFFALISQWLIIWALIATIIAYTAGYLIELKRRNGGSTGFIKGIMLISIILIIGILVGLKYTNFFVEMISSLFSMDISFEMIAVPIGISFYTLQGVGYVLDVYWEKIEAQKNILKLLLFIIFFPTLMEGPICRYSDTNTQLYEGKPITCDSIVRGTLRIGIGLFKRMLIADRLNAIVNYFYLDNVSLEGLAVIICAIFTTIQLYMEFAGTIDIVIGSAIIFNIKLPENFRQPFMAKSAAEFWRRWHITLGVWLKSYVFFPVTTSKLVTKWNKFGRKRFGKHFTKIVTSTIALFPVWLINGLWHGPKITYIAYGMYYFIILVLEIAFEPAGKKFWKKIHLDEKGAFVSGFRMFRTWIVIVLGEMLFRAESLSQFVKLICDIFTSNFAGGVFNGKLIDMGLTVEDLVVVIVASVIVFILDHILEKNPTFVDDIPKLSRPKRWAIYYGLVLTIVIFGAYGAAYRPVDLIYANF